MVALPPRPEQEIINRIYGAIEHEKRRSGGVYLGRLGASSIGDECPRAVWLSWRAYTADNQHDGRMLRLFETGHLQEDRIVADLRRAGLSVWDRDPDTGLQFEYSDETGHLVVKLDGVVKGVPTREDVPHVLEIKTHNKNSFSQLQKKGVQQAKPTHYMQMQTGMWLSGMRRALYVSLCKDDESYYVERVRYDPAAQEHLSTRVIKLVDARLRPAGISDDGSSFGCKYCSARPQCTREQPAAQRTCRSCRNCAAGPTGSWVCELSGSTLTRAEQVLACEHYEEL